MDKKPVRKSKKRSIASHLLIRPSFTEDEIKQAIEEGKKMRQKARSVLRRKGPNSNVRFR